MLSEVLAKSIKVFMIQSQYFISDVFCSMSFIFIHVSFDFVSFNIVFHSCKILFRFKIQVMGNFTFIITRDVVTTESSF